jgi:RNA-directed DNA polymerase
MKITMSSFNDLELSDAATRVTTGTFDRFPSLVMDRCLSGAQSLLIEHVISSFGAGHRVNSETLTIPRRGFGPRPVTITSPVVRVVYSALVESLSSDLPTDARGSDSWEYHEKFGGPDSSVVATDYLVEFDIASCYEYIDHEQLRDELLLRTMNVGMVQYVTELLHEISGRDRGLPQLSSDSDVLADAYLEIIERDILRSGFQVSRFADDFKIPAADWGAATGIIEDAAEIARRLGLILSTEKTNIRKADTIAEAKRKELEFFATYFAEATSALRTIDFLWAGYGDTQILQIEPEQEDVIREALMRIFKDWYEAQPSDKPLHASFLPPALGILGDADDRIPDDWLSEAIFRRPIRLDSVCNYLLARPEMDKNWISLDRIMSMPRQSPWAKIWLLNLADRLGAIEGSSEASVQEWAKQQLADRHEVVRSEAAWFLASCNGVNQEDLTRIYRGASSLTRPAVAAACARLDVPESSGLMKAIKQDGKLTSAAVDWGRQA